VNSVDGNLTGDPFGDFSQPTKTVQRLGARRFRLQLVNRKIVLQQQCGDPLQDSRRRGAYQAVGDEVLEGTCFTDERRFAACQIIESPVREVGDQIARITAGSIAAVSKKEQGGAERSCDGADICKSRVAGTRFES
jgi:hypothetical protein